MKRPEINITPAERMARVAAGALAAAGGLWLLLGVGSWPSAVLEILLVLTGLDLVVTGVLGHCPLYRRLGHMPPSLRRST